MDDAGVIVLIQALGDATIAIKWIMNTHSHSDFSLNI
jgi:glyoxylase-like metal-dependent hydrolase (beta-lactamase superfamily II)